ncbi:kinase-like domain-containing protein [Rhizophagus irregularis DAOM 181602=DAOM 197198]|nr:kinase-like domain-containing protein [Rhizophagus irregularis DAOM 181602=DAOM 197198]
MAVIFKELVYAEIHKAEELAEHKIQDDKEKQYEFIKQTILADKGLTSGEKSFAIKLVNKKIDKYKVRENKGERRISQFSNWTSENDNIDNLIRECQMETLKPDNIVEWIPYDDLESIDYLTENGGSKIYKALWVDGYYDEWDFKENQLKRIGGKPDVVLKKLENVEKANKNWIDEAKSYLNISSNYGEILTCYGLTKDPSDGNYMLVMNKSHLNLREYLKHKHNEITWRERIQITDNIIYALSRIHKEGSIHKNLHSGNILFNLTSQLFYISDFGFRGPADRPSNSIYGNLPYLAPEIIADDHFLAINIINGIRPKIESGIPLEYKKLMMQCWDADPRRRPNLGELINKIFEMRKHCRNISNDSNSNKKNKSMIKKFIRKLKVFQPKTNNILEISETSNLDETNYKLFTSKVYAFENFSEPRNGTEEEQEEFHNQPYNFSISNNVDDDILNMMQSSSIFKGSKKKLSKVPQINSNKDFQVDYYRRKTIQQTKNVDIEDEHEIYNDPNLHSEDQDELEIPWIV